MDEDLWWLPKTILANLRLKPKMAISPWAGQEMVVLVVMMATWYMLDTAGNIAGQLLLGGGGFDEILVVNL